MFSVPVTTPSEMAKCKLKVLALIRQCFQDEFAGGNNFFTNTVSGNTCNFVSFHGVVFDLFILICETQTLNV